MGSSRRCLVLRRRVPRMRHAVACCSLLLEALLARVARIDSGPKRSHLCSKPKWGKNVRIGRFVFWVISNRTIILDLAWF